VANKFVINESLLSGCSHNGRLFTRDVIEMVLNDRDKLSVASVIVDLGITVAFIFHMRCISFSRCLYYGTVWVWALKPCRTSPFSDCFFTSILSFGTGTSVC
jgi:hypothetical protein